MTPARITIAISVAIALGLLMLFNTYRWQLVQACHERGGIWDGADSRCRLIPSVIIKRDLERS
ncbi:MAG: hypothetical protein AAF732_07835 [Pseudomonadota bacterium]